MSLIKCPECEKETTSQFKKEGIIGWLSYISFLFVFIFPLLDFIITEACLVPQGYEGYVTVYDFPIYGNFVYQIHNMTSLLTLIGLFLMILLPLKSFYQFSSRIITVLLRMLPFFIFLCFIATSRVCVAPNCNAFFFFINYSNNALASILLYGLCFVWYLHYFYKKNKAGYWDVSLKVILFSIIPFLPFFYFHRHTFYHESGYIDFRVQ